MPSLLKVIKSHFRKKDKDARKQEKARVRAPNSIEARTQNTPALQRTKTKNKNKSKKDDPRTITVFASGQGGRTFVERNMQLPALGRNDVSVAIICCSVCHTDILHATMFEDVVVGHEIIGRVESRGEDVTNVEVGDVVGFGYIRSTCLNCKHCHSGQENLCQQGTTFKNGTGGFATGSVWDSRFVYKIPRSIKPQHAGPLICAGASVFGALYEYNVSPTATVGVVGIGGLGHLAIKFAKAWGCKVVAISSDPHKKGAALNFGAHEFVCTNGPILGTTKLDYILNTSASDPRWDHFVGLLEPNGTLINLGVSKVGSMKIPYEWHLLRQLKVVGSLVASRHVVVKMLEFAARHKIEPEIEEYYMGVEECKNAFDRIIKQEARYRIVLNVPHILARTRQPNE